MRVLLTLVVVASLASAAVAGVRGGGGGPRTRTGVSVGADGVHRHEFVGDVSSTLRTGYDNVTLLDQLQRPSRSRHERAHHLMAGVYARGGVPFLAERFGRRPGYLGKLRARRLELADSILLTRELAHDADEEVKTLDATFVGAPERARAWNIDAQSYVTAAGLALDVARIYTTDRDLLARTGRWAMAQYGSLVRIAKDKEHLEAALDRLPEDLMAMLAERGPEALREIYPYIGAVDGKPHWRRLQERLHFAAGAR